MLDQGKCLVNLITYFVYILDPAPAPRCLPNNFCYFIKEIVFYTVHPVVDSLVEQFYANVNTSLFKFVIGFGENGFLFNIREADARIFI